MRFGHCIRMRMGETSLYKDDFQNHSPEQKANSIVRDTFDLLVDFLRGSCSTEQLHETIQTLSELGVLSKQEIIDLLKAKVNKEGCETSVGKGREDLKDLWDRAGILYCIRMVTKLTTEGNTLTKQHWFIQTGLLEKVELRALRKSSFSDYNISSSAMSSRRLTRTSLTNPRTRS